MTDLASHWRSMTPRSLANARSIGLYGATGSGKTTLIGEYALDKFKSTGKRTLYHGGDMGGFDSILPVIDVGALIPVEFDFLNDNPWNFIEDGVSGKTIKEEDNIGAVAFDSATSMGEALLNFITKTDWQVGTQKTQKFTVNKGDAPTVIGVNNEAHYGLVQTFMLDQIWKSTWLVRNGIDVIWTFGEWRGEDAKDAPVIGPAIVGKALTPKIPRWLKYTLRSIVLAEAGQSERHQLQISPQPEMNGMATSMINARFPLGAAAPPPFIEPASLVEFFRLVEAAREEAKVASQM